MRRTLPVLFACLAGVVHAVAPEGVPYHDDETDPSFAAANIVPGWRRLYEGTGDERGVAIAATADGGFVVAAEMAGGANGARIGLFRLDRDGNYVTSGFGNNGRVFKDAWLTSVADMAIDAQGRIVVIGATPGADEASDFGVVRFKPDGSDDTSFGGDGGVGIPIIADGSRRDAYPTSLLLEADGRIVVAGNAHQVGSPTRFAVLRLNTDGSLDAGFGDFAGVTLSSFANGNAYAAKILPLPGSQYVVVGTSSVTDIDTDFGARILRPGGGVWAGATGASTFLIDTPSGDGTIYDNARDAAPDGQATIVVAGSASGRFAAIRIRATGTPGQYTGLVLDDSFTGRSSGAGCTYCYVSSYTNRSEAAAVKVRSDGRIVIAGSYLGADGRRYGLVSRLKPNGYPDTGWVAGIVDDTSKSAPTTDGLQSWVTGFADFLFAGGRMVAVGGSVDDVDDEFDYDAVITRFRSDLVFADTFK